MKKFANRTLLILILVLVVSSLAACSQGSKRVYPKSVDELNGLRAGSVVGTIIDSIEEENFPDSPISYVNTYSDMLEGIKANKIDFFVIDKFKAVHMLGQTDDIKLLDDVLYEQPFGVIFRKNDDESAVLKAQWNEFIAACKEDGRMQGLIDKWLDTTGESVENAQPLNYKLSGENGTLNMACAPTSPPYCFMRGTEINGFDIEMAYMFCEEYGYGLEFCASDFSAMIPGVATGKCDFGATSITITEERAENVDFSEPYVFSKMVPVVPVEKKAGFSLAAIQKSFHNTFVREDRWNMILNGLIETLEMFFGAAILGTILGMLIYMLCRKGNKILNKFFDLFASVFHGLPMVVVLMIFYYVILAESSLSGVVVAIIAFAISVMLSVYSQMKTAVKSIDNGQIEGAYSLGFNDKQTFYNIIFPQAMEQFIPNYNSTLVNMLKGTAIVGYIAVQDLTKVSDIIRARTYEAFFPLIATAIIYLLLVLILIWALKMLQAKFEPKRRSDEKVLKQYNVKKVIEKSDKEGE